MIIRAFFPGEKTEKLETWINICFRRRNKWDLIWDFPFLHSSFLGLTQYQCCKWMTAS